MALNDREKFIMHMVTIMTLASMGDPIDVKLLQKESAPFKLITFDLLYNLPKKTSIVYNCFIDY